MAPYIPNWIQPADPAAQWAKGFPMGTQVGEFQQQQQLREEEAARQAQQFAQEQEMAKAKMAAMTQEQQQKQQLEEKYFTMASKSAADKASAMLSYQQDIAGGTDSTQAAMSCW